MLTVRSISGVPVYLCDVADVRQGLREDQAQAWRWAKDDGRWSMAPAVSLAVAKRAGLNSVVVSNSVVERLHALEGSLLPDSVMVSVTHTYLETANEKANALLFHLGLATISIVTLNFFDRHAVRSGAIDAAYCNPSDLHRPAR